MKVQAVVAFAGKKEGQEFEVPDVSGQFLVDKELVVNLDDEGADSAGSADDGVPTARHGLAKWVEYAVSIGIDADVLTDLDKADVQLAVEQHLADV